MDRFIETDASGWLSVRLVGNNQIIPLPQYLRVTFERRAQDRDFFEINEGVHSGAKASVSARGPRSSWLGQPLPTYGGPVSLTFKKGSKKLLTPIGELNAITDTSNPLPNGRHPIQLPDFPHSLGQSYTGQASKAMTWFYLGTGNAVSGNNDRYLHPGRVSAGCLTVEAVSRWDQLYAILILARAPGGRNIGSVTVNDL